MSFSYNENLVLETNSEIEENLSEIKKETIIALMNEVIAKNINLSGLLEEFRLFKDINGEHIKNYFVIGLNGIQKVWSKIISEKLLNESFAREPLYENVFSYLDLLIDEINFDLLFQKEIIELNK